MQLNPYLMFDGDCADALAFYQAKLGARAEGVFHFGESPHCDQVPPGWADKVMHSALWFGESMLMACDAPPGTYEKPQGFSVTLNVPTAQEAERLFEALTDGGTVTMAIAETFWAERFGTVTDRFGIPWMINGGFKSDDCPDQ